MTTQPAIPFLTGGDGNRLREAAITSLPGDSGQSFKDAVVDSVIDVPAWESRLISFIHHQQHTARNGSAANPNELCELVKFERGQSDSP
jgi:hypothetical protein